MEETGNRDKLTTGQRAVMFGKQSHDRLTATCAKDAGNPKGAWRIWDKDVDASGESKLWQDAMKRTSGKPTPWLLISNPAKGGGFEGELPKTEAEFLALLSRFGG